jgi:hypothetical protein
MSKIEVTNVKANERDKIPELYMCFPDKLEDALIRIGQLEEKLSIRGYSIVKPYNVIRIEYFSGKPKQYYLLAFELRKK